MNIIRHILGKNICFYCCADFQGFIWKTAGKRFPFCVIYIQDCNPRLVYLSRSDKICEKSFFAFKILINGVVIIQMILAQVGKYTCIKLTEIYPVQVKSMGRNFHDNVGNAGLFHFKKSSLKLNRIRGCYGIVKRLVIKADINGSDDTGGKVTGVKNTFYQPRGCRLSIGSGNADKR